MEKFIHKMREDCFDGAPVIVYVVNTTNEIKKGFELFKPCDNVCSKYFEGDKLVIDGVEIYGRSEVSYQQILWHMLLYGMNIKGTAFFFDRDILEGTDFTFRVKSVSVDGGISLAPMTTNWGEIVYQNKRNCIKDRHAYNLGYSDSILIDIPPLSKVDIYLYQDSASNTRKYTSILPTTIN